MVAIDTVAGIATIGAGPVFTAITVASGDSLTVRAYPPSSQAWLYSMNLKPAATHKGQGRVHSPRMHDNTSGINFATGEAVSTLALTGYTGQPVYGADTLVCELNGTAADVDGVALGFYYASLPGSDGRFASAGDIQGNVKNLKPFYTAITTSGTAGNWSDTVITTTDNQWEAGYDYAILGYLTDTSLIAVGVKGQETGNLRVAGPGSIVAVETADYFVQLSNTLGMPCIPVVNANNRAGIYVSAVDIAASTTANITLVAAQLASNFV